MTKTETSVEGIALHQTMSKAAGSIAFMQVLWEELGGWRSWWL